MTESLLSPAALTPTRQPGLTLPGDGPDLVDSLLPPPPPPPPPPRPAPQPLASGRRAFPARASSRFAPRRGHRGGDPYDILDRIRLSRAFTCFQLAELIENAPAGPEPLIVLDLLATFYDESVPLHDSERLLATTLTHLRGVAPAGPCAAGAATPRTLS